MTRILVTPRSLTRAPDPALRRLEDAGHALVFAPPGETPDEATLLRLLPGCVGWICGVEPVSARVLRAAAPTLRVISRNGVGVDNLPLTVAAELAVTVLRAVGANAQGVAELAIGLMLAAQRDLPRLSQALREGRWQRSIGREIGGRTVGVVGCGAVGQRVVRAALGLGASVLGHDPVASAAFRPDGPFAWCDLDALLAGSDIVSLHCPMPEGGAPLLDARRLASLPGGAIVVNTARAGLVAEDAVLAALEDGRLAAYCTDVFATEPPDAGPLLRHERVLATPHLGGYTAESVQGATTAAVDNLLRALETGVPR